ncbi:MAG TPA: PaaI family thioesterase [Actinomycetota bacterium]|nr:PaaI family thioesterase [Actinomycetota bacterium]
MYVYEEPARGDYPPLDFIGMSGIDRMRAGVDGRMPYPPNHHLTGLRSVDVGDGYAVFSMPVSPWFQAYAGLYPAGICAVVADAPLGGAVLSKLAPGVFGVTSELSINYLRPVSRDTTDLFARARLINAGSSLGLSECVVEDAAGRVLAHATSRYFLSTIDPPPSPSVMHPYAPHEYATPDPWRRPLGDDGSRVESVARMTGLEAFHAYAAGEVPPAPFARLLGIHPREATAGNVTCTMRASKWLTSPARTIYGGNLAFFADFLMTSAASTTMPAKSSVAMLDVKVQYLRPGLADDQDIVGTGTVVHRGRNIAVTRAEIRNAEGKAVALATGSAMVLEGRPWAVVSVADEAEEDSD